MLEKNSEDPFGQTDRPEFEKSLDRFKSALEERAESNFPNLDLQILEGNEVAARLIQDAQTNPVYVEDPEDQKIMTEMAHYLKGVTEQVPHLVRMVLVEVRGEKVEEMDQLLTITTNLARECGGRTWFCDKPEDFQREKPGEPPFGSAFLFFGQEDSVNLLLQSSKED